MPVNVTDINTGKVSLLLAEMKHQMVGVHGPHGKPPMSFSPFDEFLLSLECCSKKRAISFLWSRYVFNPLSPKPR